MALLTLRTYSPQSMRNKITNEILNETLIILLKNFNIKKNLQIPLRFLIDLFFLD